MMKTVLILPGGVTLAAAGVVTAVGVAIVGWAVPDAGETAVVWLEFISGVAVW